MHLRSALYQLAALPVPVPVCSLLFISTARGGTPHRILGGHGRAGDRTPRPGREGPTTPHHAPPRPNAPPHLTFHIATFGLSISDIAPSGSTRKRPATIEGIVSCTRSCTGPAQVLQPTYPTQRTVQPRPAPPLPAPGPGRQPTPYLATPGHGRRQVGRCVTIARVDARQCPHSTAPHRRSLIAPRKLSSPWSYFALKHMFHFAAFTKKMEFRCRSFQTV